MKKLILLLLSINFVTINSIQIISCKENEYNETKHSKKTKGKDNEESGEDNNSDVDNNNNNGEDNSNNNGEDNNNNNDKNEENDFIVDLDEHENPIETPRGWKGTLMDENSMKELLVILEKTEKEKEKKELEKEKTPEELGNEENGEFKYKGFTSEQYELIKKFTVAMHAPASKKSIEKFNKFLNQKTFKSFDELVNTIDNHNENSPEESYLDVPLELIRNHVIKQHQSEFEEVMLKVYNAFSYFFGEKYGYKIVRTLAMINSNAYYSGLTVFGFHLISIKIKEYVLKQDQSPPGSWFTTWNIYHIFAHEYGHAVFDFHISRFPYHEKFDQYSGLSSKSSQTSVSHNEYKIEYCKEFLSKNLPCKYKISPKYKKDKSDTDKNANSIAYSEEKINYSINQNEELKKFIFEKVKNLKITGSSIDEQTKFLNYMILKMFINSGYGCSVITEYEVPSEGFAYWLLTPDEYKDKTWEVWNEFFLERLFKLRSETPHFNDYLKNEDKK